MPIITQNIHDAVAQLLSGRPVAIPTETVYGLAALYNHEDAIKEVYRIKQRPLNHPLIVHVACDWDLYQLVEEIPFYARELMQQFWPGPLTLVFRAKEGAINPLITGNQPTVAIRSPAHPITQALLEQLHLPIVAPSANPFGKVSPTTAEHVAHSFANEPLTILDGGRCTIGIESTIIDATNPQTYSILRHGMIDEEHIAAATKALCLNQKSHMRVPGALDTHYQPQKKLFCFDTFLALDDFCHQQSKPIYVIASQCPKVIDSELFHHFSALPDEAAFELYFQLRQADNSKACCIAIELPPNEPKWQGVRERILKAGVLFK
jgi:L-threonylcarbamoyladenylate synthase